MTNNTPVPSATVGCVIHPRVPTSGFAWLAGVAFACAGVPLSVVYGDGIGQWLGNCPPLHFPLVGGMVGLSIGMVVSLAFGATLSRIVCWQFGCSLGLLAIELIAAIAQKVSLDTYAVVWWLVGFARPCAMLIGFLVTLLSSVGVRAMRRRSLGAAAIAGSLAFVTAATVVYAREGWVSLHHPSLRESQLTLFIVFATSASAALLACIAFGDRRSERLFPVVTATTEASGPVGDA